LACALPAIQGESHGRDADEDDHRRPQDDEWKVWQNFISIWEEWDRDAGTPAHASMARQQ